MTHKMFKRLRKIKKAHRKLERKLAIEVSELHEYLGVVRTYTMGGTKLQKDASR